MAKVVEQAREKKLEPLSLDEALEIASRHGIVVYAKPLVMTSDVDRGVRVAVIYLPYYKVTVEVYPDGESLAWVDPACNS